MRESLGEKQERFSRSLGMLLNHAEREKIGVRMGECWRTEEQARWYAEKNRGIINSNHRNRLAVDLILAIDGIVLWDGEPYEVLARFWKGLGDDYCWGGDFKSRDVYHYSIKHGGVV